MKTWGSRGTAAPFENLALDGGELSGHTSTHFLGG
jgi:hypothetical protein